MMTNPRATRSAKCAPVVPSTASQIDIGAEMTAWEQVADLVGQQREMIIKRDHEGMPELNRCLAQAFAHACRMRSVSGPPALRMRTDPFALALDQLQRRVRAAASVNRDLISDMLAYVDFSLELLCPQIASPIYDQKGQLGQRRICTALNRSV